MAGGHADRAPTAARPAVTPTWHDRAVRRRVVITGLGIESPLGSTIDGFWDAVLTGRSGAVTTDVPGVGPLPVFAVDEADRARDRFGQRESRRMSRAGRFAALAAAAALQDAGDHGVASERIGASVGSVHGGTEAFEEAVAVMRDRGADRMSPLTVPLGLVNSPVAATSRALGLRGPSSAVSTACAAGSDAIGTAVSWIRDGRADLVVAGGAEAPITPLVVGGYLRLGALSRGGGPPKRCSRPFDRARDGFVIGEGAGILVLEERERALARGARIYAEIAGYGASCDAAHPTDPDPDGLGPARAIRAALADADVGPEQVVYVNAHATSTPAGDVAEAHALRAAGLGGAAVSSTKACHGHGLGAAGGMEAVAAALAVHTGRIPPTANLDDPDPDADLDHVRGTARVARVEWAVSNSFGFGGHNACLVLRRA